MCIHLTGDHEVLTEEGYVAVESLPFRARVATGQGLSPLAWDVVCGTLLGDASIAKRASILTMSHCLRHRDYASFKAQLLEELLPSLDLVRVAAVAGGTPGDVVHVRTLAHRSLRILRAHFYGEEKRVPTWLAQELISDARDLVHG